MGERNPSALGPMPPESLSWTRRLVDEETRGRGCDPLPLRLNRPSGSGLLLCNQGESRLGA